MPRSGKLEGEVVHTFKPLFRQRLACGHFGMPSIGMMCSGCRSRERAPWGDSFVPMFAGFFRWIDADAVEIPLEKPGESRDDSCRCLGSADLGQYMACHDSLITT